VPGEGKYKNPSYYRPEESAAEALRGDGSAYDRKGKQAMFYLPPELALTSEETTVVGDIDAFIEYVESGQALRDWHERLAILTEECDTFLREHSHVWSHIIIQPQKPDVDSSQAA